MSTHEQIEAEINQQGYVEFTVKTSYPQRYAGTDDAMYAENGVLNQAGAILMRILKHDVPHTVCVTRQAYERELFGAYHIEVKFGVSVLREVMPSG